MTRHHLPGLAASLFVTVLAFILAQFIPLIGVAPLALVLGMILGNTLLRSSQLSLGTKLAESRFLEYAIILLAFTMDTKNFSQMGLASVAFVSFVFILSLGASYKLAQRLGFSQNASILLAGGTAICGSSAIGALAPMTKASEQEKGTAIVLVNLLGTLLMFLFPFAAVLLHFQELQQAALIGGTLQSVGQVAAAANLLSPSVLPLAMLFKLTRILYLVPVLFFLEFWKKEKEAGAAKKTSPLKKVPYYLYGFILASLLNTLLVLPAALTSSLQSLMTWLEWLALAAIGLRLDLRTFMKNAPTYGSYILVIGLVQFMLALVGIWIFGL